MAQPGERLQACARDGDSAARLRRHAGADRGHAGAGRAPTPRCSTCSTELAHCRNATSTSSAAAARGDARGLARKLPVTMSRARPLVAADTRAAGQGAPTSPRTDWKHADARPDASARRAARRARVEDEVGLAGLALPPERSRTPARSAARAQAASRARFRTGRASSWSTDTRCSRCGSGGVQKGS